MRKYMWESFRLRGVALSEASEEVVEYWLNVVRGFFTIRGLKVGNREIDFLAIKLDGKDPVLGSRAHVEVNVSAYARAIRYWPPQSQAENVVKKFNEKHVKAEVTKRLGENYSKVFIFGSYGRYKPDKKARSEFIDAVEKLGVKVVKFEDVLKEVQDSLTTATYTRPALRMIQYYKYIPEW
jgi:hypothetical protein